MLFTMIVCNDVLDIFIHFIDNDPRWGPDPRKEEFCTSTRGRQALLWVRCLTWKILTSGRWWRLVHLGWAARVCTWGQRLRRPAPCSPTSAAPSSLLTLSKRLLSRNSGRPWTPSSATTQGWQPTLRERATWLLWTWKLTLTFRRSWETQKATMPPSDIKWITGLFQTATLVGGSTHVLAGSEQLSAWGHCKGGRRWEHHHHYHHHHHHHHHRHHHHHHFHLTQQVTVDYGYPIGELVTPAWYTRLHHKIHQN